MDFGVWFMLDQKACATSHKNIDALKYSLKKSWNEISPETLRATYSQVIDRLRCVIRAKGGYFKYMLINLKVYLCTFILSPYFKRWLL